MPEILSLALFEQGDRLLVARRKATRSPFAGQWLLPAVVVANNESAEEALERHTYHELGVEIAGPSFAETLYLQDAGGTRYVANVFRVSRREGELRFRTAGDYDDVRWLTPGDLAQLSTPSVLLEWLRAGAEKYAVAAPLAVVAGGPAPDNRAAWNAISRAYQDEKQIATDRITYGPRCPSEDELHLLGDVSGLRVIVLGCGGGQDAIVLAKQGAQVIGVDLADKQIEYARRLADRESVLATFVQGNVEELRGIEDGTQELALSIFALQFVERVDHAFAEAFRVLKPGSSFVLSVNHPVDACLEDTPPYALVKSYWERQFDWQWEFPKAGVSARLREWHRPVSEWLSLLADAGFRVERVLEPPPTEEPHTPWDRGHSLEKMRMMPSTLIIKAVKP